MKKLIAALITTLFISACSIEHVQPWDRELLARDKMQLEPDKMEGIMDEKIYFSKEGSRGGPGIGGGGCGCN